MNTERIRALADLIEQQPHTSLDDPSGFNMQYWLHECGTPCCAGGFAEQMIKDDDPSLVSAYVSYEYIRDWFGTDLMAFIFAPDFRVSGPWSKITPSHAAAVLRHLADHGVVDWTVGVSS